MPQFVKILNRGPSPFRFYNGPNERIIKVGDDAIIPWGIATANLGDPTLLDVGKDNRRTNSLNSILQYHGYQVGMETGEQWEERRPHIEVYDLDNNERIFMLIEDPDGKHAQEFSDDFNASDVEILQRQVAMLSRQLNQVLEAQTSTAPELPQSQGPVVSVDGAGIQAGSTGVPNVDGGSVSIPQIPLEPSVDMAGSIPVTTLPPKPNK